MRRTPSPPLSHLPAVLAFRLLFRLGLRLVLYPPLLSLSPKPLITAGANSGAVDGTVAL